MKRKNIITSHLILLFIVLILFVLSLLLVFLGIGKMNSKGHINADNTENIQQNKPENLSVSDYFPDIEDSKSSDKNSEMDDYLRLDNNNITLTPTLKPQKTNTNYEKSKTCPINGIEVDEGTVVSGSTCIASNNL
jgi:hypothetical protein